MEQRDRATVQEALIKGGAENSFRALRAPIQDRVDAAIAAVHQMCDQDPILAGVSVVNFETTKVGTPGKGGYRVEIRIIVLGLSETDGTRTILVEIFKLAGKCHRQQSARKSRERIKNFRFT